MKKTHTTHLPRTALALLIATVLAACSSTPLEENQAPVESRSGSGATSGGSGATAGGAAQSQVTPVDITKTEDAALARMPRTVYFDFDSYVVKDEFRPVVEANAKVLTNNRTRKVSIEGHADERGGREYNLALGQRRAEAVARSLALLGASQAQVEAVSFGEERPADAGHDEAAWEKNRRAELVYR